MKKQAIVDCVAEAIAENNLVIAARIYGSWFFNHDSEDLDIAIMIPSRLGVVELDVYQKLRDLREKLCLSTSCDIDLVPHTMDEITNLFSPMWYPRYNPSLVSGTDIKGRMPIESSCNRGEVASFADMATYVLLDNRTICRRQLVRTLEKAEARIFVSKLLHGPGNALTRYACRFSLRYICSPSDLVQCFRHFDDIYNVDSMPAMNFLQRCKKEMNYNQALQLMLWYETLISLVVHGESQAIAYNQVCKNIG